MRQITKGDLDLALKAWEIAREKALLINQNWALFLKSQQNLIRTMRENGWTYDQAKTEVENASNVQGEALKAAWKEMDDRCSDYLKLEEEWKKQQQQP